MKTNTERKPWAFIVWTTYELIGGVQRKAAVVWKKRCTEADIEAAREYAATLEDGRVVVGDAKTKLEDLKSEAIHSR